MKTTAIHVGLHESPAFSTVYALPVWGIYPRTDSREILIFLKKPKKRGFSGRINFAGVVECLQIVSRRAICVHKERESRDWRCGTSEAMSVAPQYSVYDSRPREIFRYSEKHGKITFDYSCLKPYGIPSLPCHISMKSGWQQYKRKVFHSGEVRVKLLLIAVLGYEAVYGKRLLKREKSLDEEKEEKHSDHVEILCHNGLHSDLLLKSKDMYYVMLYKGKLLFSNTDTRSKQNPLMSYIGIKFESVLTRQKNPTDSSHCKVLLEGKYGKWPFKSVVEVDAYKRAARGMRIEQTDEQKRVDLYVEMKLCLIPDLNIDEVVTLKSKQEQLEYLRRSIKTFKFKVQKWLFQTYLGRQDHLVIGLRDDTYQLRYVFVFDVVTDLLPFMKESYTAIYNKFESSVDTLDVCYTTIYEQIKKLQKEETDVFILKTNNLSVVPAPENVDSNAVLTPEWLAVQRDGKNATDALATVPEVDMAQLEKLKIAEIDQQLSRLQV